MTRYRTDLSRLGDREADYLLRLARGQSRKRIAADEGISRQMVDRVVDRALDALAAGSVIEAFAELGWLEPELTGSDLRGG